MRKWRRKNYLINPRLQLSVLAVSLALSFLLCATAYAFFSLYFGNLQEALAAAGIGPGHPLHEYLLIQKSKLESILATVSALMLVFNTVVLSVLTHRIAGPVYRMHRAMESLLRGEGQKHFKLREGDFFRDTAAQLDEICRRGLRDPEKP